MSRSADPDPRQGMLLKTYYFGSKSQNYSSKTFNNFSIIYSTLLFSKRPNAFSPGLRPESMKGTGSGAWIRSLDPSPNQSEKQDPNQHRQHWSCMVEWEVGGGVGRGGGANFSVRQPAVSTTHPSPPYHMVKQMLFHKI